jgi:signal transduction histidine kinase
MSESVLSARSQRDFIHDLASPLTVALGMVDSALRAVSDENTPAKEKLEKAKKSLLKMNELMKARRELLVKASEG